MNAQLYQAIQTYAKAAAPFDGTVAGPWSGDMVPPDAVFPYATFDQVGLAGLDWTTDRTAIEPIRVQFSLFTNTSKAQAFALAKQLTDRFDFATLSLSAGKSIGCLRIFGPFNVPCPARDASGNRVWHVATDYRITLQT